MADWSRSTSLRLEALGVNNAADTRSTKLALEVTSLSDAPIRATGVYLEVLARSFVPVPYVPDTGIPWTIKPHWGTGSTEGVVERLKWKTDVRASQTNVEQRGRLRNSPRMEIDCVFHIWRTERRLFDAYLMGRGAGLFHVPLWWERYTLEDTMYEGDYLMSFDTRGSGIVAGSLLMILGHNPFLYEMVKVHHVTDTSVVLANTLAQGWLRGTTVYLTKKAQIADADVAASRMTDEVVKTFITFEVMEPNDYPPLYGEVVVEPYPQLDFSPAYMNDITYSYHRAFTVLDNDIGIRLRRDVPLQAFNIMQADHLMKNAAEYRSFKRTLYFLQGKLQPFRLSTYFNDMQYLEYATTVADDNFLFIRRCGLAEHMGSTTGGRKQIAIHMRDGTVLLNTIVLAAVLSDDVEAVIFAEPWGSNFTLANIKRISYSQLVRQDQDDVEILHINDIHGAATCTTTFMTLADGVRSSDNYTLEYYTGNYVRNADAPALPIDTSSPEPPPVTPPTPFYGEYSGGTSGEGNGEGAGQGGGSAGQGDGQGGAGTGTGGQGDNGSGTGNGGDSGGAGQG